MFSLKRILLVCFFVFVLLFSIQSHAELLGDMLSVDFNTGAATDNSANALTATKVGTPSYVTEDCLGKTVVSMDTASAYYYTLKDDDYTKLADGFSVECYVYISSTQTARVPSVFGNKSANGFAIEYHTEKKTLSFLAHNGSGYAYAAASDFTLDTWHHVVGVYDGANVMLYQDGTLVGTSSCTKFNAPTVAAQKRMYLGADVNDTGAMECSANLRMRRFNLFSYVLTAEQVSTLKQEARPTFTFIFKANGGTGSMENQEVTRGVETPIRACAFKRDGYIFVGWNAYRPHQNRWYYTCGKTDSVWAVEGKQPENYVLSLYKDQNIVSATGVAGYTVELYAVWVKLRSSTAFKNKATATQLVTGIRTKAGAPETNRVMQGACADGTYAYFIMVNPENTTASIIKMRLSDYSIVKTSKTMCLDHGNDATYHPGLNKIMVTSCYTQPHRIFLIDPDTLTITGEWTAPFALYALSYNETRDVYVVGTHNYCMAVLDKDLNLKTFIYGRNAGYVTQGIDCDDNYIYATRSPNTGNGTPNQNVIEIYDYEGNFIQEVPCALTSESENIFHVGNTFYSAHNIDNGRLFTLDFKYEDYKYVVDFVEVNEQQNIDIQGWFISHEPITEVRFRVNGEKTFVGEPYDRPDVAAVHPEYPDGNEGFRATLDTSRKAFVPGENTIKIRAYREDLDKTYELGTFTVNLKINRLSASNPSVVPGETVTVNYATYNSGAGTVAVYKDGSPYSSQTVAGSGALTMQFEEGAIYTIEYQANGITQTETVEVGGFRSEATVDATNNVLSLTGHAVHRNGIASMQVKIGDSYLVPLVCDGKGTAELFPNYPVENSSFAVRIDLSAVKDGVNPIVITATDTLGNTYIVHETEITVEKDALDIYVQNDAVVLCSETEQNEVRVICAAYDAEGRFIGAESIVTPLAANNPSAFPTSLFALPYKNIRFMQWNTVEDLKPLRHCSITP